MDPGLDYQNEVSIQPIGNSINTTSYITDFQANDVWVDQGWGLHLTWNYDYTLTATFYLYKEPKRMTERFTYFEEMTNLWQNDNMALTGYPFSYKIRRSILDGDVEVAYSDPEICVGASADEVPPDQVTYHEYSYDPQKHTLFISWNPLDDPTLGGYWVCPTTVGEKP